MKKKCREATAAQNIIILRILTFHARICTCILFYYPVSIICIISVLSYLLFIIQKMIVFRYFLC